MSELRQDPISGRWVVIAEERAKRPRAFVADNSPVSLEGCPFCEGHEDETPRELFVIREENAEQSEHQWRVRVVRNKYPALELDAAPLATGLLPTDRAVDVAARDTLPGVGSHEVIIESPEHVLRTTDMSPDQLTDVLVAYRERLRALREDPRLKHALVFKNVGTAAGATLEHAHSQLIALPFVPPLIEEELQGAERYYERHGESVFDVILRDELAAGERIVAENDGFVAFCPFASRAPYEMWIMPRVHASHYEETEEPQLGELARLLHDVMHRLDVVLHQPAYNHVIHSGPFDRQNLHHYHWYVEVVPRVTKIAGFEWATGCVINVVQPEKAAEQLRAVMKQA